MFIFVTVVLFFFFFFFTIALSRPCYEILLCNTGSYVLMMVFLGCTRNVKNSENLKNKQQQSYRRMWFCLCYFYINMIFVYFWNTLKCTSIFFSLQSYLFLYFSHWHNRCLTHSLDIQIFQFVDSLPNCGLMNIQIFRKAVKPLLNLYMVLPLLFWGFYLCIKAEKHLPQSFTYFCIYSKSSIFD